MTDDVVLNEELQSAIEARKELGDEMEFPKPTELATLGTIAIAGCLAGLLPALRAYRLSLADGMTVRT